MVTWSYGRYESYNLDDRVQAAALPMASVAHLVKKKLFSYFHLAYTFIELKKHQKTKHQNGRSNYLARSFKFFLIFLLG